MWDSVIKNISILIAVATLAGSATAFLFQRADEVRVYERESKRVFLEKQAETYFEVVALVSKLATIESRGLIDQTDINRFWRLYWGEFAMVEDGEPAKAMTLFAASLVAFQRDNDKQCAEERESISLTVAHCIRQSLGESWDVSLKDEATDTCTDVRFKELEEVCPTGRIMGNSRLK